MKHFAQHHFFLHSLCYRTEYLLVGAVNEGVIEPFQIDACCALGSVSHRFADGCYRYILALGDTCPRVTRHIRCEFGGQAQLLAQFLQVMVDEMYPVLILTLLVNAGKRDKGSRLYDIYSPIPAYRVPNGFVSVVPSSDGNRQDSRLAGRSSSDWRCLSATCHRCRN